MISRRFLIVSSLAMAGCASLPQTAAFPSGGPYPELEPVRLVQSDAESLVIGVASRGCAARPDMAFHVERRGGVATIAFARRRLQSCSEHTADWTEVLFSRAQLGLEKGEPVFLLNPVAAAEIK